MMKSRKLNINILSPTTLLVIINLCLFAFSFYGCSYLKTEKSFNSPPQNKFAYVSAIDAFKNADIAGASEFSLSNYESILKIGLEQAFSHDFKSAGATFFELYNSSKDDSCKAEAANLVYNVLFYLSEWEKIQEFDFHALSDVEDEDNIMVLAKAFAAVPREEVIFHADESSFGWTPSLSGCPVIPCYINGELRYFWFDTGANYSVISSNIANECNVLPIIYEKSKAKTSTSRKVFIYPAIADSLKIGEMTIKYSPFVIVDHKDLELRLFGSHSKTKIDGIIGWKAIQHMDVSIDHKEHTMTIRKPVARNIPLSKRNLFWLGCPFIKTTDSIGTPLIFGLDFGSEKSSITHNIFNKIKFENIYQKVKPLSSAGGSVYFHANLISRLELLITGYSVEFNEIGTTYQVPHLFLKLDGILGSDFMENSIVNIDILNGSFTFQPYID